VQLFDGALSAEEVGQLASPGSGSGDGDGGPALDQGLSAHWNFESDTVSDGGVSDQSGNDNDGSFVGDPEVDSGAVGDGMSLHSDGDWVQVDHSDSLQVQTGDFTLAAWVNTEVETNQQTVISKKTDDGVGDDELGYQMTIGGYGASTTRAPAFQYADGSGVNVSAVDQGLSTDTWYHLAVSYDHENTTVEWFIDGSSVKTEELSGTPITNEQELFLGAHFDSSGNADQPLDGMLDDVRIYNEAKGESFIGDLHGLEGSSGDSTLDQGLVAHWTFESDTVSDGTVSDQSGNGNDGSIIGNPSVEAGTVGDGIALSSGADWVQVDHSDSLQVQTDDFTLAGWVNIRESRAISQTRPLVSKKTDDGVGDDQIAYQLSVGGYPSNAVEGGPTVADAPTFVYADGNGNLQVSTTDESLSTDTWHHLAVSYDHENSTVEWFANGSSVKTEELSGSPIANEQEAFLGVHFDSGGAASYALNGLLDDIRIYGDAKEATFIQSLYELGN
jgi:hypothetical protein